MPPRGHSRSSHHSSHRSHHSSHSSHRSSSSFRSHRSHSHGTNGYREVRKTVPRPDRSRYNQPGHYVGTKAVHRYNCIHHDYIYYPEDWVDATTGVAYQRGYYDETGERFDTVIIDNNGIYESRFDCPYCGTSTKETWTAGAAPHCPNCGANLIETQGRTVMDQIDHSTIEQVVYEPKPRSSNVFGLLAVFFLAFVPVLAILTVMGISACSVGMNSLFSGLGSGLQESQDRQSTTDSNLAMFGNTIYVDSIGRSIVWKDAYQSYYDSVTDCYAWYNTDVEPAVWQYWYEGISSDYGDYGWMEYELDEDQWYIEVGENHWEKLPEKYDKTNLWCMTGKTAGTSYSDDQNLEIFGQYIKVDSEPEKCYWDGEYVAFYVEAKDCYVRVAFEVLEPIPQYWYEDISNKYCEEGYGGWMEYDAETQSWYIADSRDVWKKLTIDTSDLWHVEKYITGESGSVFTLNSVGTGNVNTMDADHANIYFDFSFNPYAEDYYNLRHPDFYQGDGFENLVDGFFYVDSKELDYLTEVYILPHESEIREFFEKEKNSCSASSIEELANSHYSVGNTLDVTGWFDQRITIKGENGTDSHEFIIRKVELSVQYASYFGEPLEEYYYMAEQHQLEDQYVRVEGVSFEFFVD